MHITPAYKFVPGWGFMLIAEQSERAAKLRVIGIHKYTPVLLIKSEFCMAFVNPVQVFSKEVGTRLYE